MTYKRYFLFYLIFYFVYLCAYSGSAPLFESTEGRFAEIAREMYIANNYIEPTLNGIKHFHKPPFAYWMMAAGIEIFGVNTFGVRFFGIIASLVTLIATFFTAKIFVNEDKFAFISTVILSTSLLFLIVSCMVAIDIYLTAFTSLCLYFMFKKIFLNDNKKREIYTYLFALFLGLAFLTKGYVVFIFTLIPYVICKIFFTNHRKVYTLKEIVLGFFIFLLVALPWYIIVIYKNTGLLAYFIKDQIFQRVVNNKFNMDSPWYFFIPTIITMFFPYIFYLIKGTFKIKELPKNLIILYIYILIPLIIFSINRAKLITYILPFYGLAAIITAYVYFKYKNKLINKISYCLLILSHVGLLITLIYYFDISTFRKEAIVMSIFWGFIILALIIIMFFMHKHFIFNVSLAILALMFFSYMATPYIGDQIRGYKRLCDKINAIDPERHYEVVTYMAFIPSISFYRNKKTVVAFYSGNTYKNLNYGKETQFETNNAYKKYYLDDDNEFLAFIKDTPKFFLVAKPKRITHIETTYNIRCTALISQRTHTAYFCER